MKKVLIFLLMVGILMLGTCAITEELSKEVLEHIGLSGNENTQDGHDDPIPCGGGDVDGGGPIPG